MRCSIRTGARPYMRCSIRTNGPSSQTRTPPSTPCSSESWAECPCPPYQAPNLTSRIPAGCRPTTARAPASNPAIPTQPHTEGGEIKIQNSAENNKKLQLTPRPLHEMLRPITEFYTHYRCTRGPPGCASLGDEVINYMAYSSAARRRAAADASTPFGDEQVRHARDSPQLVQS